ncbi:MAG: anthranilate phosphoribosyltransferase [Legionellales bacterium RIFCSPHIGHO2_12_FULL_35_11]|nr:MAG: anthranilate phosphoribosyltransferase [Legionellales bacterium RIFCSPHIGHO2_12_FULL_35_11]
MKVLIDKLYQKIDLTKSEMEFAMIEIFENSSDAQIATFLALLHLKDATSIELYSVVKYFQSIMVKVNVEHATLDIVGTGGDGFNTINISTGAALLAACCGVKIAKHGNRSVSSMTGSADMLENAGLNINLNVEDIVRSIDLYNFGFLYAPNFHPMLTKLKTLRTQIGIPTILNLVGPLINPCEPNVYMIGVSCKKHLNLIAEVLIMMRVQKAIIYCCNGMDEICTVAPIDIIKVNGSRILSYILEPVKYGFSYCKVEDLIGGNAKKNVDMIKQAFKDKTGPIADSFILNAGMACYLYGKSKTLTEGILLAKEALRKEKVFLLLQQLSNVSSQLGVANE